MQKPHEKMSIWTYCIAIIVLCISIFIVVEFCGIALYGTFEGNFIDDNITKIYNSEIKPNAEAKIFEMVKSVNEQEKDIEKIRTISKWTSQFTYPDETFQLQDQYYQFSFVQYGPDSHYLKDNYGRWFIRRGKYAEDLNIITYFETGRCGEISKVWNYTANLTGFVTRQVGDPSGYHAWIEVLQEDEWYYVDPTIPPSENLVLWYNSTKNRNQSQLIWQAARVMNSSQDITHHYPPYGTVRIYNIGHYDSLFIRWEDEAGKTFIEPYDIQGKQIIDINLSIKNYSISTTGLWRLPVTNISIVEGEAIEVELFHDLIPLRLQMDKMRLPKNIEDFL